MKLSINLEMPQEPEYKPSLMEKIEDCMERVEFGSSPEAYNFLRKVINCATKCYRAGKRSDKLHELLGKLTPFMSAHGMEDHRGMDLVSEYVSNPDYKEKDCE